MKRLITIDGDTLAVVCPFHGAQDPAVELAPGVLPCGCAAVAGAHGRLFAVKADCSAVLPAAIDYAATCKPETESAT